MKTLRPTLAEIYLPIEKDLEEFSVILKKELASEDALIRDIHTHLLKMTGKFLRPALTLLSARTGAHYRPEAMKLAAGIELIHTATLVHDDIIDESDFRRNQPSIHSKWGRDISIISGDYLYAKAFLLLADLQDIWVNQAFARCAHVMCEGEMKQIEKRNHFLMSEAEYLKIIHQKTAALFQAACMGGSYFSGADPSTIEKLGSYGFGLGMAFQITDDCLDIIGETESLGKTVGLDLNKNDVTLPLLYLFQALSETERAALVKEFKAGSPGLLEQIKKRMASQGSVERAMEKAQGYIQQALKGLEGVKDSPYKESLSQLAHHCLERVR